MMLKPTLLPTAAIPLAVSGLLHLIIPLMTRFSEWNFLFLIGVFYLAVAALFYTDTLGRRRWLAWIMFVFLLIGSISALHAFLTTVPLVSYLFLGILLADVLALIFLFGFLWRSKS